MRCKVQLTSLEVTLDAVDERSLRTGDNQVNLVLLSKSNKTGVVIALDIGVGDLVRSTKTSATVSGSDVDDVDERRLAQLPSQSMFTATIADNENAQLFGSHFIKAVSRVTGMEKLATVGVHRGVCPSSTGESDGGGGGGIESERLKRCSPSTLNFKNNVNTNLERPERQLQKGVYGDESRL